MAHGSRTASPEQQGNHRLKQQGEQQGELQRILSFARPYRVAGYAVLLFECLSHVALSGLLVLSGSGVMFFLTQRHPGWLARRRPSQALLLIQGGEAALLAGLIWLLPLTAPVALLLSASLLLANGALGGLPCLSLAAAAILGAACLSAVALPRLGSLLEVQGVAAAPIVPAELPSTGFFALLPASTLLIGYGLCFSVLGYSRVRRLQRRQQQQHHRLVEERTRADRLQRYLPQSLREHLDRPVPGARERCWLLIVYVDLCDFTPLTARLDADALAEVLDGYLLRVHRLAESTDGVVAKVLGDGVLLFWRAFRHHEQGRRRAAQQALQFARTLPRQLSELSDYWRERGEPVPLKVRAALTSGYCTLGDWGTGADSACQRLEYTVIGTPVNLAARLQVFGAPGGVVVDERTRLLFAAGELFDGGRVVTVRGLGEQRIFELDPEGRRSLTLVQ